MFAYKGFNKDLTCRGYKFKESGINEYKGDNNAKCVSHGFHCAENPLDCLSYYPCINNSIYYIVEALGDIHEDGSDTKISCTKMKLIKKLSVENFVKHAILFMIKHPERDYGRHVSTESGESSGAMIIIRGKVPKGRGSKGAVIGLVQEYKSKKEIKQIFIFTIDEEKYKANTYYNILGEEVSDGEK